MTAPTTTEEPVVAVVERCAACGHASGRHDTIATRYCAATVLNAIERTCICGEAPVGS
jgi:hypothetical protein